MNLTEEPEVAQWPDSHYAFIERIGPFATNAPEAWQSAHSFVPALSEHNRIIGYTSFYKPGPEVYRAGFLLGAKPRQLPDGLSYETHNGGKYVRFVLTGPYSELGRATSRVFELVAEKRIRLRDDFCIENYVTDPRVTPEDQNVTQILLPAV